MAKDNHHFIPQGYLRRFAIEGEKSLLWEYDKEAGAISREPKSIRKICCLHQYYAQEDESGNLDKERLENAFSQSVEDPYFRLIDKLLADPKNHIIIEPGQKALMALFISTVFNRGPSFRDGIKSFHTEIAKQVAEMVVTQQLKQGAVPRLLIKAIEEKGLWQTISLEAKEWVSLEPMIYMAQEVSDALFAKRWRFFSAPDDEPFVVSDNPVVFSANEPFIGPSHPLSIFQAPLNKKFALYASPSSNIQQGRIEVRALSAEAVRLFNEMTVAAALRFIYAPTREDYLLALIKKHKTKSQKILLI